MKDEGVESANAFVGRCLERCYIFLSILFYTRACLSPSVVCHVLCEGVFYLWIAQHLLLYRSLALGLNGCTVQHLLIEKYSMSAVEKVQRA